LSWTRHINI